jgi:signal transduction histidine kinase
MKDIRVTSPPTPNGTGVAKDAGVGQLSRSSGPLMAPSESAARSEVRDQFIRAKAEFHQKHLRDAIVQVPAIIFITRGPHHIIEGVNALCLESIGGSDVLDLSVKDAWPDGPAARLAALDRAYETGQPAEVKELTDRLHTKTGLDERILDLTVQPLKDDDGIVYGLMAHAVDVTDHVKTRNQLKDVAVALERTNRELDSFAYAASHDLRAPLRGIANLAQWIEEDLLASGEIKTETREMLELMRGRMHRMESLIEGLLEYSRAGRVHHKPETVDVSELVREVVDLLSPPDGAVVIVAQELPVILTERLLLQQVFQNLIGNAIKHANRADPTVTVGSKRVGPFYEFSVGDNGGGIAPEFHDRIWGIFQTLEARDRVEGAGIGLALVKKIVEAQSGRVWVESTPGAGATFRFLWRK